jgi:hypothetical protein
VIFACPSCSASHFKPDAEAKAGVIVTCRRCKTKFKVTAAGVEELPPEEQKPAVEEATNAGPSMGGPSAMSAEATVAEPARGEGGGFEGIRTDVMLAVPQSISSGGLADALEPEPADADMIETVDVVEPIDASDTASSAGSPTTSSESIVSGFELAAGEPIDSGTPIDTGIPIDAEPTAGDVVTAMASGESVSIDVPNGEGNAASVAPEFGGPTELLQGPLLAALQAEASKNEGAPVDSAIEPRSDDVQLPHAFDSAATDTGGDPAGTRIDQQLPNFDGPEPAPVAAQQRSHAESESGAGTFEPIAATTPPRKRPVGDKAPDFPRGALRTYMRDLGRYFTNGSPVRKLVILFVLALPLALLILLVMSLGKPKPLHMQWVTAPAAMWSGPAAQRGYAQVDTLVRGEEVIALEQQWGEYTLVRDVWGRVGYVNRESLTDDRPSITPESAFPGCRQAPIETDKEPCEGRARSLHDACGATCASDGRCLQRCQDRFTECIDGCKTRLTVPASVAAVPAPTDAVPGAVETEEPTDPTEVKAIAAEKPAKGSKPTKPTKPVKKTTSTKKTTKSGHR